MPRGELVRLADIDDSDVAGVDRFSEGLDFDCVQVSPDREKGFLNNIQLLV